MDQAAEVAAAAAAAEAADVAAAEAALEAAEAASEPPRDPVVCISVGAECCLTYGTHMGFCQSGLVCTDGACAEPAVQSRSLRTRKAAPSPSPGPSPGPSPDPEVERVKIGREAAASAAAQAAAAAEAARAAKAAEAAAQESAYNDPCTDWGVGDCGKQVDVAPAAGAAAAVGA